MKLSRKKVLVLAAASVISILLSYAVLRATMYPSFVEIEKQWAAANTDTVAAEFMKQLEWMAAVSTEYSQWDDTFDYFHGDNEEYVSENITRRTLDYLDLDAIVFLNADGSLNLSFDDVQMAARYFSRTFRIRILPK
jgi:sensor domain CHASE-containing protein